MKLDLPSQILYSVQLSLSLPGSMESTLLWELFSLRQCCFVYLRTTLDLTITLDSWQPPDTDTLWM